MKLTDKQKLTMKKQKLMTEKQFISKFKKHGFELYKTKDLKSKLNSSDKLTVIVKEIDRLIKIEKDEYPILCKELGSYKQLKSLKQFINKLK